MSEKQDVWNHYPPELLEEAEESRALAEAGLLSAAPLPDADPYNLPMAELVRRWRERQDRKK